MGGAIRQADVADPERRAIAGIRVMLTAAEASETGVDPEDLRRALIDDEALDCNLSFIVRRLKKEGWQRRAMPQRWFPMRAKVVDLAQGTSS